MADVFLNAYPIGFDGGLNWYMYANGNPLMFIDPHGLYPGQGMVDYVHDAIINPANGTLGGSIVAGIEGAGDGFVDFFPGFITGRESRAPHNPFTYGRACPIVRSLYPSIGCGSIKEAKAEVFPGFGPKTVAINKV